MAKTVVILIRVVFGLVVGFAGLVALSQGLVMISHEDFSVFGPFALALIAGVAVGSVLLFGSWRLLSTTLRLPTQETS